MLIKIPISYLIIMQHIQSPLKSIKDNFDFFLFVSKMSYFITFLLLDIKMKN